MSPFDVLGNDAATAAWQVDRPDPTTLIAVWPHRDQPKQDDVMSLLREAAGSEVSVLGEMDSEGAVVAWNTLVAIEPDEPPLVIWVEPLYPDAAGDLKELLPPEAAWVIGVQTMLDLDDPVAGFAGLMRLVARAIDDSPAILDVATDRWYPRHKVEELFLETTIEPPANLLWVVHATRAEEAGAWIHTQGLSRCGLPELELLDIPQEFEQEGAHLLEAIGEMMLELTLPPPGVAFSAGHEIDVVAQPWREVAAFLEDHIPGSASDPARSQGPAGSDAEVRAVICAPEQRGVFRKAWVWPEEALRRLRRSDAILFQSKRSTERQARLARETWPNVAAAFEAASSRTFEGDHRPLFTIKVAFSDDGDETDQAHRRREHLWFRVHGVTDDMIAAELLNEPAFADLRKGDVIEIPASEITDWGVAAGGQWFEPQRRHGLINSVNAP